MATAAARAATSRTRPAGRTQPPDTPKRGERIKVRAKKLGYYGDMLRHPGDVFVVTDLLDEDGTLVARASTLVSTKWMERVPASTPNRVSGPQDAIDRETHRVKNERAAVAAGGPTRERFGIENPDDGDENPLGAD